MSALQFEDKIKQIKSIRLLSHLPERQLAGLAQVLKAKELPDGAPVFEEGSMGMSLYFISSGQIRIAKRSADGGYTDLAVLAPGDFFGESALVEEAFRSASAIAVGPCVLLELFRGDLHRWTMSNPQQAVQFFADLVNLQSRRLRRTSDELTLHCDLSNCLADEKLASKDFMGHVLTRTISHLGGGWSAAAYLSADGKARPTLAASFGAFAFDPVFAQLDTGAPSAWVDPSIFHVALCAAGAKAGDILFRSDSPVHPVELEEIARTFTGISRLVLNALETIALRSLVPRLQ